MDSPRVAPPLHHGIDRHLPHGQPPPDPTPVASCIHRRLVAGEKRRWDVDCINDFELMFWCAHENFDFSPPHLPPLANHPTPTSHPIRLPYPLEYIVDEGKTKYQGEKSPASLFARYFWLLTSHTSFYFFSPGGILLHAPRPQNIPPDPPIPSNTSSTKGKRNMEVLRGREGASQWGESSSCIFSLFSASHLRLLVVAVVRTNNTQQSTAWKAKRREYKHTHNNQPSDDTLPEAGGTRNW